MKFFTPYFRVYAIHNMVKSLLAALLLTLCATPVFSQLTVSLQSTPPPCGGINNGMIIAIPADGVPPYSYSWNTGAMTQSINMLPPGNYGVTVTDDDGGTAFASVVLSSPPELMVELLLNNCTSPGTITANPIGGTAPFDYNWNTGEDTQAINFLNPGQYCVTVSDGNLCGVAACVLVPNAPPSVNVTATDLLCAGDMSGEVTATPAGGTPPYTYLWDTGDITQTVSNLGPGTYCVTLTDQSGCTATDCGTVSEPPPLTVVASGQDPFCVDDDNGTASAVANGGTPPITYSWSNGGNGPIITGLTAGTYTVTATDANGCDATDDVTLTEQSNIMVTASATDVVCYDDANGSVTASASNGVGPYSYLWNTGANTSTVLNLPAGTYSVTATDQLGCTAITTATIGGPPPFFVTLSGANVSSCGAADGSATATVMGGVQPLSYLWNTGEITPMINGLVGGVYIVTVTDATGCTATGSIFIGEPTDLAVSIDGTDEQCDGANDGTATAIPLGGNAPFTYNWSNGQMTATISNLEPGMYSVTVVDANGCTGSADVIILSAPMFSISLSSTDVDCFGDETGTAMVVPLGGTMPYTYLWSNGAMTPSIDQLAAGAYTVTVTDDNGCEEVGVAIVEEPSEVMLTVMVNDEVCVAGDASAMAFVSGGTPPYDYLWSTGETTPSISDLFPGLYSLTVTDDNDCEAVVDFEVLPPNGATVDVQSEDITCFGEMNGSATAIPTGGTAPFSYLWNTGAMTSTISNLGPGVYSVTVTDDNNCEASGNVLLLDPQLLVLDVTGTNVDCPNGNEGTAQVFATGGTPPFDIQWSNGQSGPDIINLSPGTYFVTVTDDNDCEAIGSIVIESESDLDIDIAVLSQPCPTGAGGSLEAIVTGAIDPIMYLWSTGDNTPIIINVPAGQYGLTVTDGLGCVASATVDLLATTGPSCQAIVTQPVSVPGASDGAVTVIASGGSSPYTYLWSNGAMTADNVDLPEGIYSVTVTDNSGCETTCTVQLGVVPVAKVGNKVWEDLDEDGIQDSGEPGFSNVCVNLTGTDYEGNPLDLNTSTDGAGMYIFDPVPPGDYKLTFCLPPNYTFTNPNTGNDAFDSDVNPNTNMTEFFTLVDGDCDTTRDAGIYLFCENVTDPGQISGDETLCGPGNDPGPIVQTIAPSGGTGPLEFLWLFNTDGGPFDPNVWNQIPNSNSPNYDPGPISQTTYYIRCVRREGCVQYLESNIVAKVVDTIAVAIIDGSETACLDELGTYSAPDNGPGATYSWNFGIDANPQTSNNQIVDVVWSSVGLKTITLEVTNNGCTSYASMQVIVTNSPAFCGAPFTLAGDFDEDFELWLEWSMYWLDSPHVFTIERSVAGAEFLDIASIEYNQSIVDYTYLDLSAPEGWVYYRIRLEDENNNEVYSNIVEIMVDRPAKPIRKRAYPNPTGDNLMIDLGEAGRFSSIVEIYSLSGQQMKMTSVQAGNSQITIPVGELPSGVYLVRWIPENGQVETFRMIKK